METVLGDREVRVVMSGEDEAMAQEHWVQTACPMPDFITQTL